MAVSVNAAAALNGTGAFATCRRGGVHPSEIRQVQQKLGARATPAQMAKVLGRCEADVRAAMDGPTAEPVILTPRRREENAWDEIERKAAKIQEAIAAANVELVKLWEQGVSAQNIGQRLGRSEVSIRRRARLLGLPPRQPGRRSPVDWTPELDELVRREYVVGGKSAREVAKMINGATKAAVIARSWRLGLAKEKARLREVDDQRAAA